MENDAGTVSARKGIKEFIARAFAGIMQTIGAIGLLLLVILLGWKLLEVGVSVLPEDYKITGLGELKLGSKVDEKQVPKPNTIAHRHEMAQSELKVFTTAGWYATPKSLKRYAVYYRGIVGRPTDIQHVEMLLDEKYRELKPFVRGRYGRFEDKPCNVPLLAEIDWERILEIIEKKRCTIRHLGLFMRKVPTSSALFSESDSYEVVLLVWDSDLAMKANKEQKELDLKVL